MFVIGIPENGGGGKANSVCSTTDYEIIVKYDKTVNKK